MSHGDSFSSWSWGWVSGLLPTSAWQQEKAQWQLPPSRVGVEPQVHHMPLNFRQRTYFSKAPSELPWLCMKELSLLVPVGPVCSTSVGLFQCPVWVCSSLCAGAVPVLSSALHKTRHDLCPKEFHQAARCLDARKSPAIIHTLKIAGAKWEPAFQNQVHYVSAKYIIST